MASKSSDSSRNVAISSADGLDEKLVAGGSSLWIRSLAEFAGTFLVLIALLGGTAWTLLTGLAPVYVAIIAFISYALVMQIFHSTSGAHLNPAITLAAGLTGRLQWLDVLAYVVAQLLGGFAAAATLMGLLHGLPSTLSVKPAEWWSVLSNSFGSADISDRLSVSVEFAIVIVFIGTVLVVAAALNATDKKGVASASYPVVTGLGYAVATMLTVFFTGGGMNPARSTAAAIIAIFEGDKTAISDLWVFWVVPLLAGAIVGLIDLLFRSQATTTGAVSSSLQGKKAVNSVEKKAEKKTVVKDEKPSLAADRAEFEKALQSDLSKKSD